jgi:hypothetical protein
VSNYWIKTSSPEHALVDKTFTRLEDRLNAVGYQMGGEITYVEERNDVGANRTDHDDDRRVRVADRGDQHGRARERDHDEHHRAHA